MKIIKRNGSEATFDLVKIIAAVTLSLIHIYRKDPALRAQRREKPAPARQRELLL